MKKIFLIGIIFLSNEVFAQNAYYDALAIAKYVVNDTLSIDSASRAEYSKILNNYLKNPHTVFNANTIFNDYCIPSSPNFNPFLKGIFPVRGFAASTGNPLSKSGGGILSSVGGLDVTNIADGLARFLIKRGKEELNVAFFQRMKKFLDENIEGKTLFPATSNFLGHIASYRYAELLQSLREAFYKDLKTLIVNLNLLIDLPKYRELLKALPEVRVVIRSAKIMGELSQSDSSLHPANLIHRLAYLNEWNEMDINLENSWKLLDVISESVRRAEYDVSVINSTKDSIIINRTTLPAGSLAPVIRNLGNGYYQLDSFRVPVGGIVKFDTLHQTVAVSKNDTIKNNIAWIKFSDFHGNILQNEVVLRIYLGLLYQKVDKLSFRIKESSLTVKQFMAGHVDDIFTLSDLVENFLLLANDVEQSVKDLKEKVKPLTNDDYYTYIEKAINVIEYGFKVANTIKPGITDDRYITIARNASNLYKNIYTKNYNAAVMNSYLILNEVLAKSKQAIEDKKEYIDSFLHTDIQRYTDRAKLKRDTAAFRITARSNAVFLNEDTMETRSQTVERILKYGNVMASIVKAESPEEAEAAIEAAALPAGSSSIKKNSRFNVSLNAYIGGYYSNYTNDIDKIDGSNSKIGVTAPVGIAFSWGLGHFNKGNGPSIGSLSAYLTLIDVGAIAGYRLSNDSTALEQKVTIDDIFAPGGYIVYGIGLPFLEYVPLSIGYGYQYGSKLYYKNSTGTLTVSDKSRWRGNLFIAIDIPLANFWTRSAKKIQK